MDFEGHLKARLAAASERDLLRTPARYEVEGGMLHPEEGPALLSFASNDYLGLSQHPAIGTALADGARRHAGAGSSRVVTGTAAVHVAAEAALAELVQLPAARLFPSAYAANVGLLGSLFGREDLLLSDARNHASLIDGCRLSRAHVEVYAHGDLDHLRALLRTHRGTARVAAIVTETAFSMDGDVADVAELHRIARESGAALIVDEAHALGVMGPEGRGLCAAVGVRPDVLIGGLGKSFGLGGGFLAGSRALAHAVDNFARTFVFSTAVLPALAHAVPTAVDLVREASEERKLLAAHAVRIRDGARQAGAAVLGAAPAVILPMILGSAARALEVAAALRARGLLVPAMRPPTVAPGTARLRITPTALHTEAQIGRLLAALAELLSPRHGHDQHERDQP